LELIVVEPQDQAHDRDEKHLHVCEKLEEIRRGVRIRPCGNNKSSQSDLA
jgi:hypothetical protein